ncbi:phage tail tape measure protein [Bradyrhizobium sp. STM 3566]|uniref:phage tail tape measure protein n=1 Tax=Bradyrhizobium sp. STM 3566 TaxID=578928 RepID=UPI00388E0B95
MSNPSVTATISADDKASPKLRELVELTQRLAQTAKAAFNESAGTNYTNGFRQATSAAMQHLSVLEKIHKVQSAIGATVAGVAGAKALQVARSAFTNYIPYERDVRYQRAIQHYSDADMALLERQRINAATVYGLKPEDTLHAQQAFVTRNFSAPITEAATKQAIVLAKALNVKTDEAAKIVEGLTFGQGIHLHNPAQASREIARSTDLAAIAAKAGAMSPEDIQAFGKFGIGMSTAAGISAQQAFAAAMTLKRANVGGDESGVFMRQFSARLLAPTKQAFEAFAHMGINYADFAPQGNVSPEAIDASLRRRYGKGLSDAGKASLAAAFGDESRNVLGSREGFTAAVREAVEASGEKLSKMDQKHLVDTALRQYDLAKGALNGGALFEAILQKASARDIQAILGDKQGGRAALLLGARDQYGEYLEKLNHGEGFAQKIAEERMQGLAAAVDRLSASIDSAEKQMVKANEGWLTPLADAGAKLAGFAAGLSDAQKQTVSVAAGLASLSGLAAAGATIASVISSFTGLAASANVASAALTRMAGGSAVATAANAAGGVAGSRAVTGLGLLSKGLGWLSLGTLIGPTLWDETRKEAAGIDDAKGGGAANYRRNLARLHAMRGSEFEDLVNDSGPFDRYQPSTWNVRRGATSEYLRQLGASDDGTGSRFGWQDSIRAVGQSSGFKDVAVTGTVSGEAELHQSLQIEVKPTAYFESLVKRMEAVANMHLNGQLGTGLQGPGDNSVKPPQGPPTGAQE